jgi:hypothetical protein
MGNAHGIFAINGLKPPTTSSLLEREVVDKEIFRHQPLLITGPDTDEGKSIVK